VTALDDLRATPNALAEHYTRFGVADRMLLSGHSHQAWPDVAREAVVAAFDDAARDVDGKWPRAFAVADAVRAGFRVWLDDPDADLALGASTHELVVRLLSALDLRARPRVVTTDGEFHTLRRQLGRAAEAGLDVARVAVEPVQTLSERLAAEVDDATAAVFVSAVLFETSWVVDDLALVARAADRHGAELVVDAYHALGPVPFSVRALGLDAAWVVGGGYKYLQLGEGSCFLRVPPHAADRRPAITGWYAEFGALAERHEGEQVAYGAGGAARFAGSTYDPTSHYRAERVFAFLAEHGLTPAFLPTVYRHQVAHLAGAFDALDLPEAVVRRDRAVAPDRVGGFLALRSPHAGALQAALAQRGVMTDSRGSYLRLGPAPYLSDAQLDAAVAALRSVATSAISRS
jgi:selenocysteine lyase/cysteine desulfurase